MNAIRGIGEFPASYRALAETLSISDGIIVHGSRIVVPTSMRKEVLQALHRSHQGIVRTKQRARQCVFWPNINAAIESEIRSCVECQREAASQPCEPMFTDESTATYPFQELSTDIFEYGGKYFLVVVDRYTGWPCVAEWNRCPTSNDVIKAVSRMFADFGVPVRVRSDGGPQFKSAEWLEFLKKRGAVRSLSSPLNPMGNGHAEAAVRAMKTLVAKTGGSTTSESFLDGLREWRNTPKAHGKSPAELMFGRSMRSVVPALSELYKMPDTPAKEEHKEKDAEVKERIRADFDAKTRPLPKLTVGSHVWIQDQRSKKWDTSGIVIKVGKRRSYDVQIPNGRIWKRNRRFLKPKVVKFEEEETSRANTSPNPSSNPEPTNSTPRRSQRPTRPPDRYRS